MKTNSKYFIMMLITMSILQPGCKHDHHNEESTKLKHVVSKPAIQIAKKL